MELAPRLVEHLLYGLGGRHRWTQDSPVLPDVWAAFASPTALVATRRGPLDRLAHSPCIDHPEQPLELLLTPHYKSSPGELARQVRERLELLERGDRESPNIVYTQSYVAARLYFDEVVRVLIPLTSWWRDFVWKGKFRDRDNDSIDDRTLEHLTGFEPEDMATALDGWSHRQDPHREGRAVSGSDLWTRVQIRFQARGDADARPPFDAADDLLWMVQIIGAIQWGREQDPPLEGPPEDVPPAEWPLCRVQDLPRTEAGTIDYRPIVEAGMKLLACDLPVLYGPQPSLWQINRNRPAGPASFKSRRAIKADAASELFDIRCDRVTWAVIDSGIDARHPAFSLPDGDSPCGASAADWARRTRIRKTFDFTRLRPLLDPSNVRRIAAADDVLKPDLPDALRSQLQPLLERIRQEDEALEAAEAAGADRRRQTARVSIREQLEALARRLSHGWEIDWSLLESLLEVPHTVDGYVGPTSAHGTHVAGILAGRRCAEEKFHGICPDIFLYDLRVFDREGPNDELTVLAALQFVQHLNQQKDLLAVHGVNLSLSIPHQVSSYACGRTPVCEECERLVASGVVVVAAAGNAGWDDDLAVAGPGAGYRTVSITDPGNAEGVITVGATHRDKPHTYGVSFFSGRGPTGDGRMKPDLVAPGEKITSCVPGDHYRRDDGTSMAAPHVSGAAALIMARHAELVGQPQRIKRILCEHATDLGRERTFQGAGMLDVLRALQAV